MKLPEAALPVVGQSPRDAIGGQWRGVLRGRAELRVLETCADLGLAVRSPTLGGLFAGAGYGFTSLVTEPELLSRRRRRRLELHAGDRPQLLVRWLNGLVALFDSEAFLGRSFEVQVRGTHLSALLKGDRFDPDRHPLLGYVKAATYHQLRLTGPDPWSAEVILDV